MSTPIETLHLDLGQIREQRCLFLLLALVALLVALPFLSTTTIGRVLINLINIVILLTAVAAVGRSTRSWVIAFFLGLPVLLFQVVALQSRAPEHFALSWGFAAAFYAFILANLLQYVLRRDTMTEDKIYGAIAAYILIAILWAFVDGILQYFYPGAYTFLGAPKFLDMGELIYFSFTVLMTVGFGDITPALIQSRFFTILEGITGVMYVAILIARLTGLYPMRGPGVTPRREDRQG